MSTPFSADQFFEVFRRYNEGVWPAQVVLFAVAVGTIVLVVRGKAGDGRWIATLLSILWLWMGTAYHWAYFAAINPAAIAFGALFVLQAVLFAFLGGRRRLEFQPRADLHGLSGVAMIAYALVLYPVIGYWLGHRYPSSPTFGLPCPTIIFTFGILLWAKTEVPLLLLAIPLAWSALGFAAVSSFGMAEDIGLLAAGLAGTTLILLRNRELHTGRPWLARWLPRSSMLSRRSV